MLQETPAVVPAKPVNALGLTLDDYKGFESTLCAGCGHDTITAQIIKAFYESGVPPHMVAKISGIGCSSKTPAYFFKTAHGFNGCHGRMPPVATGALLANRRLSIIGISGDGDTGAIGIAHFVHTVRRNPKMIYIIENNGIYALTKGQFSPTADVGSTLKHGEVNTHQPLDCCGLALELGATFVARSFAADMKQLCALLKAALHHNGTAVLDVISPCVSFGNHEGSTKSYKYVKERETPMHEIDVVACPAAQAVEIAPGAVHNITLSDGSIVRLKKLAEDHDPTNREAAVRLLDVARRENQFLTGLIYVSNGRPSLVDDCNLVDEPLATLPPARARLSPEALKEICASYA